MSAMSDIAQALAKAKARTGHTASPFLTAEATLAQRAAQAAHSATALRRARARQRFWLIWSAFALPLTGFVVWMQLRSPASADSAPVAQLANDSVAVIAQASALPASASTPSTPQSVTPSRQAAATPVNEEARRRVAQMVADLPISAVMPGEPSRIMLSGRVVRAGETAEKDLVFLGVAEGQLQFADASGGTYSRRY